MNLINKNIINVDDNKENVDSNINDSSNSCENNNILMISNIENIQQRFEWDCGLACLDIVFKWWSQQQLLSLNLETNINQEVEEEQEEIDNVNNIYETKCKETITFRNIIKTKSIWSIDLSDALHTIGIQHDYFTTSIGMNETHKQKPFYIENWETDEYRIMNLFNKLKENQPTHIFYESLPVNELIKHIKLGLPAIVLVDSRFLICSTCNINSSTNIELKLLQKRYENDQNNNNFNGHFIVIAGYDLSTNEFIFIDPSLNQNYCRTTINDFEYARSRPGTDMDIILIQRENSDNNNNNKQTET